jgi:hypothetical protein
MADISINKFRTAITRGGATPATPGFAETEGQDPVNPSGSGTQYGVGVGLSLDPTNRIQLGLEAYGGNRTIQITDWEDSGLAEIVTQTLDGTIYQNLSQFSAGNRQFYTNLTNTVGSGYATLSLISRNNSSFLELSRGSNTGFQGLKFLQDTDGYLMQITDTINSKGLEYFSDYESNFTARSLVTKQYVDGALSVATISIGSPANGLSLAGTVLSLGLASSGVTGALSGTDWNTFNGKIGGTIASGQVAFGTGANTVGGSNNLFWDSSTNSLGLGTNTPFDTGSQYSDLSLNGTQGGFINFLDDNVRNAFVGNVANELRLGTSLAGGTVSIRTGNDVIRVTISSGGNFGIATTSPTNTLDVNGTTRIRTISNLGSTATRFLVASATGVVSERTGAEMRADLSVIGGTIASGQVAFGTGANTVGGSNNLVYTASRLDLTGIAGTNLIRLLTAGGTNDPNFLFFLSDVDNQGRIRVSSNNNTTNKLSLSVGNAFDFLNVFANERVSIGNITPTNTLDVNGTTRIRTISNLGSTATRFLVASATGVISERTGAELAADIGAIAESTQVVATSGTINDLSTTASTVVFTGATVTLTGIVALVNGTERTLVNLTGSNLTISYFSASSAAANRFLFSHVIPNRGVVTIKYSTNASNVWLMKAGVFTTNNDATGAYSNQFIGIGRLPASNIGLTLRSVSNTDTAFALATERLNGTRTFEVRSLSIISYVESFWQGTSGFANQWVRGTSVGNWATIWQSAAGAQRASVNNLGDFNTLGSGSFGVSDIFTPSNTRLTVRGAGTTTANTLLLEDSAGTDNAIFLDNGRIQFLRLPTSSAGLGANDLWNDGGNVVIGTTQTFRDESTAKTTASADQTLPSGVLTILDYDTTVINNNTSIYTVGTTGRITVNSTGIYTITAGVVIEADAVTALESAFLGIFRNGDLVAISSINTTIAAGAQSGLSTSTILSLTSGDIIDCRALVNSVGGVANGLARRLGTLLGANATQVNSLSISKSSQ